MCYCGKHTTYVDLSHVYAVERPHPVHPGVLILKYWLHKDHVVHKDRPPHFALHHKCSVGRPYSTRPVARLDNTVAKAEVRYINPHIVNRG